MIEQLRKVMKKSIEKNEVAGVSLLLQKGGEEICFLAEGMADIENDKPMERNTLLRLFSMTKPFCAAAVMILMERGQIDLYQPVSDILPGFKNQKVWKNGEAQPVKREITIFDLLQMTAGLYYPDETCENGRQSTVIFNEMKERFYGDNPMSTVELANRLGSCPLAYEPGTSWNYGTCADILGAIVEVVSEMRFSDFLKKELFDPLEMHETAFWVPQEKQSRLAATYEMVTEEAGNRLIPYVKDHMGIQMRMEIDPAYESGGGGLVSTMDDCMKFTQMLLNGGILNGTRILRAETVKFLTDGQLTASQQEKFEEVFSLYGHSYGKLMRIGKNPEKAAMLIREGEYGWDGWLGMYFSNLPKENMTILVGMQKVNSGTWELTRKMRNIILSSM